MSVGRWTLGGAAALLLLAVAPAAQDRPMFRSATRLVEVSVVVTDRNGRPVQGLTQAEFTLSDERAPQTITFFEVRDDRTPAPRKSPGLLRSRNTSSAVTNFVAPGGTTTVLLLDRANAGFATLRWAKQAVDQYLQRMREGDRVALYAFDVEVRVLHDVSSDAASLRRALDIYQVRTTDHYDASHAPPNDTGGMAVWLVDPGDAAGESFRERRAADTFERFEIVAGHLAGISGRKNLIWVSEVFAIPTGLGRMEVLHRMHRATEALSDAHTAVYPVDARGLVGSHTTSLRSGQTSFTNMASLHPNIETMRVVADDTGGRAYAHTNALDTSIARAVDDGRSTYVLGYYPSSTLLDGRFRRIDVKVRRDGAQVRHRAGYLASVPPTDAPGREAAIRGVIEAPLQTNGINLDAEVTRAAADHIDIAIRIGPAGLALEREGPAWRVDADLRIAQVERSGRGEVRDAHVIALSLSEEERGRAMTDGIAIRRRVRIDPAVYEIRIAVRDVATGNVGSLVIPRRALPRQ